MRQLKQFLRKRKADMLACGDCECRTLKCRREASCECVGSPEPTPTPVITYTISKDTEGLVANYTATKLEDGESVESYRLHVTYNGESEVESASITDGAVDKVISDLQDAEGLATSGEEGVAGTEEAENVFNEYKTFYNSL